MTSINRPLHLPPFYSRCAQRVNATSKTDAGDNAGVGGLAVARFGSEIGAGDAAAAATCDPCSGQRALGQVGGGEIKPDDGAGHTVAAAGRERWGRWAVGKESPMTALDIRWRQRAERWAVGDEVRIEHKTTTWTVTSCCLD